jgi:hypothetical protein
MLMKKIRRSPVITGLLFLLAVVLLFAGGVGGTQAALQVYSENYYSALNMKHLGITLHENGVRESFRDYGETAAAGFTEKQDGGLFLKHLGDDPYFQIGKKYPFVITTNNTGSIDEYLRVTVVKYWVKVGKGETFGEKGWFHGLSDYTDKLTDSYYDPSLIHLGYGGSEGYNSSAWIRDGGSSTAEREVYYYIGTKAPDEETEPLFDTLWIDPKVAKSAVVSTETVDGKLVTTYTYTYDGYGFVVQVESDAIQTHHARAAIHSGWGMQDDAILSQMKIPTE